MDVERKYPVIVALLHRFLLILIILILSTIGKDLLSLRPAFLFIKKRKAFYDRGKIWRDDGG